MKRFSNLLILICVFMTKLSISILLIFLSFSSFANQKRRYVKKQKSSCSTGMLVELANRGKWLTSQRQNKSSNLSVKNYLEQLKSLNKNPRTLKPWDFYLLR